jgi:RNA polymerase sigma factor (sigma-70 family)
MQYGRLRRFGVMPGESAMPEEGTEPGAYAGSGASARDVIELSREYRPALMAFFLRRIADHAEAEDLTQEVFTRLASHPDMTVQSGSAYLFQTAANLLRDRSRRTKVRTEYRQMLVESEAIGVDPLDPFRIAAGRDSIVAMRQALGELDETTEAIFALYRLEHMSKDVIADTFGMAVRTVEKHLTERFGDDR